MSLTSASEFIRGQKMGLNVSFQKAFIKIIIILNLPMFLFIVNLALFRLKYLCHFLLFSPFFKTFIGLMLIQIV